MEGKKKMKMKREINMIRLAVHQELMLRVKIIRD
jgi:hypothetical protein